MWWILFSCQQTGKSLAMDSAVEVVEDSGTEEAEQPTEDMLTSSECDEAYLLELDYSDLSAHIWQYDLSHKVVTELGVPLCEFNIAGDSLVSMTADSKGMLWMLSAQGDVYRVVPSSLQCSFTGINFMQPDVFVPRGLAFMKASENSPDVLYVSGMSPFDEQVYLGRQNGNTVQMIGAVEGTSGAGNNMIELAGTADGKLFGFGPRNNQSILIEIAPSNGLLEQSWTVALDFMGPSGGAWSFFSLLGRFWTFASEVGVNTEVNIFDPEMELLIYRDVLPFQTVGAALPTCAPESSGS